jgi:PAS domain S-box-containing protein
VGDFLTGSADTTDEVLVALAAVVASVRECRERLDQALESAEFVASTRGSGVSYAEILDQGDGPLVLELMTAVLSALSDTGSRLRRAEARALYAEGLSMEKIARLFGVSRQRVSSLLQPSIAGAHVTRGADRRRGGLAFTDPEYRMIAEVLPHIVWVAAPDGATEYFNTQATDYTGVPRQGNYGWRWVGLVHPDDAERAEHGWEEAVRSGAPYEQEYRIRRADGEWRWHSFRALPFRGPDGRVAKWLGTATEIEDHKRIEADLRDRERRTAEALGLVEMLQESAPVGFGFVDRDFRVVRANALLAAMHRTSVDQLLGRTVAELAPTIWPQVEGVFRQVLEHGEPVRNLEVTGETVLNPGRQFRHRASYYPVRVDGEIIGVGMLVVDLD